MNLLWSRIYDLIIKTLLCSENYIQANMKKNGCHRTNCYELFGFDVLIDSDLKPWLLEVNISPSMATDAPLDLMIKSTLCVDTFNLVGIKRFDRKNESMNEQAACRSISSVSSVSSFHSPSSPTFQKKLFQQGVINDEIILFEDKK